MDKIWDGNHSKSDATDRCGGPRETT